MHRAHSKRGKGNIQEMPWLLSTSQAIFKANLGAQSPVSTQATCLTPACLQAPGEGGGQARKAGRGASPRSLDWALCEVCRRWWALHCSMPSAGGQSWMEHTSQRAARPERVLHPCIHLGRGVTSSSPPRLAELPGK